MDKFFVILHMSIMLFANIMTLVSICKGEYLASIAFSVLMIAERYILDRWKK